MDRSPFVVAKYLVKKVKSLWEDEEGTTFGMKGETKSYQFKTMNDAYAFIKKKRPQVVEHYEWIWWKE